MRRAFLSVGIVLACAESAEARLFRERSGVTPCGQFGDQVATVGDLDGDAIDDVIAASSVSSQGGNQSGLVRVLSGKDGSTLFKRIGSGNAKQFVFAVASGDVNADGAPDFVLGDRACVDPALFVPITIQPGGALLSGSIPNDPALCFTRLFVEGVEFDPGAAGLLSFTSGLELSIGFDL